MDRDGTIIKLIENPSTKKMEPPRLPDQVEFCDYAIEFMKQLQALGYKLYIISNQPDIAKKKQTAKQIFAVRDRFQEMIDEQKIIITRYYYCYHHPDGTHPTYSKKCDCRKPAPGFIFYAKEQDDLDLENSWIVGDKLTDLECGKNAGIHGIYINDIITLKKAYKIILGEVS
jgi:D-glycero-D-manno-heptose 1,7-bisphosphate phosphatase